MQLKKIGVLLVLILSVSAMQTSAATSQLDVKAGDIYSYYTYKDSGSAWENYYYVTPQKYVGKYIMGNSASKNGKYTSGYTLMHTKKSKYSYGNDMKAPGGMYYRLITGPGAGTGSGWHLTGRYTP